MKTSAETTHVILYHPKAAEVRFRIPLSVLTIASTLIDQYTVHIVDGDLEPDPLERIRILLEKARGNALLGVSVMPGPQLSRAIPHTRQLKREFPGLPVVWGGWFPSLNADTCLSAPYIDAVVRGRGESIFPQLISRLMRQESLAGLPHVSYRDSRSTILHEAEASPVHLDLLPRLPFHLLDPARYHQRTWLGTRTTGYHSSFGCPLKCGFCAVASLNDGRWMGQSVERMLADISVLLDHGANAIEFFDNNFFVNEKRVRQFAEAIAPRHIHWWGEGTIDGINRYSDETLTSMRDAGCRMIFFGAESGSDAVLKAMNKGGLTTAATMHLAGRLRRFNIVPEFSFVLGNPSGPEDEIDQSFALIRQLKKINPDCEIILYLYSPEPYQSSTLWEGALRSGYRRPTRLEEWEADPTRLFNLRRGGETPWVSRRDVRRVHDFETVLNAYSPGISNISLGSWQRRVMQTLAAPRYKLQHYRFPLELKLALKLARHRRVEVEGL